MKLTKMLAVCAVTITAIAAMAMSASAEVDATTVTATYADGVITLSNVPAVTGEDDATLLVLNEDVFKDFDADNTQPVTIAPTQIENINQSANTTDFASIPINALEDGDTVYVRMQVDGKIYTAEYTLSTTPSYTLGDVNADTNINLVDASAILNHFMEIKLITDENSKAAADVNADTNINLVDASAVLNHFMEIKLIQ